MEEPKEDEVYFTIECGRSDLEARFQKAGIPVANDSLEFVAGYLRTCPVEEIKDLIIGEMIKELTKATKELVTEQAERTE